MDDAAEKNSPQELTQSYQSRRSILKKVIMLPFARGLHNASSTEISNKSDFLLSPERLNKFENQVGWAYSAYPETTLDQMRKDMKKMKDLGSNVVYIGHSNPGTIESMPGEPGMTFSVYYALRNNTSSKGNAEKITKGVNSALQGAREAGLNVVLPVGYQIQLGNEWNLQNRSHLRVGHDGNLMNHWGSGETASPYSPKFRSDIADYYRWINNEYIRNNPNILAINLGDEPMGTDYSYWAKQEFKKRYNTDIDDAPNAVKGEFLSGVLADHAAWSANFWKELNPNVKTMFTFHIQRQTPLFPNFEKIFAQTPDTFVFSEDTHMHDALPTEPFTERDRNLLYGMVRTLGWLSNVYNKPMMLWSAANAWGLAGNSSKPGGIPDALENIRIIDEITKQNGGKIAMVMAWGWNIDGQGVYNYNYQGAYTPDQIVNAVSNELGRRRDTLSKQNQGRPDEVLYIPASDLYTRIGENGIDHLAPEWIDFNAHDFVNNNIIYLTDGPALDRAKREGVKITELSI